MFSTEEEKRIAAGRGDPSLINKPSQKGRLL